MMRNWNYMKQQDSMKRQDFLKFWQIHILGHGEAAGTQWDTSRFSWTRIERQTSLVLFTFGSLSWNEVKLIQQKPEPFHTITWYWAVIVSCF